MGRKLRRVRRRKSGFGILTCLVLAICLVVTVGKYNLSIEADKKAKQIEVLNKQVEKLEKEQEELKKDKKITEKEIEEIARTKLGLVHKDEIIFKPE